MADIEFKNFKAVAEDFDGLLAASIVLHGGSRRTAYLELADELERPEFGEIPEELHAEAHLHGSDSTSINAWLIERAGLAKGEEALNLATVIVDRKNMIYHDLVRLGMPAMNGAVEFVRKMAVRRPGMQGIRTTARREQEVMPFLGRHKLARYYRNDMIVAKEDVSVLKPNPEVDILLTERFGLADSPERVLNLDDMPEGIISAHGAGNFAVAVATTFPREEWTKMEGAARPDLVVDNLDELAEKLGI